MGLARALVLVGLTAAAVHADDVQRARDLLASSEIGDRLRGVDLALSCDCADAVDALERAIKRSNRQIDRLTAALRRLERQLYDLMPQIERILRAFRTGSAGAEEDAERLLDAFDRLEARMKPLRDELAQHLYLVRKAGLGFRGFRDPEAITKLRDGAEHEVHPMVRQFYFAGLRHESRKACVPALLALLDERDPSVRAGAVRALIPFGREPGVAARVKALAEDDHWAVRLGCYQVMTGAPLPEAVEFLAQAAAREEGEMAAAIDSYLEHLTGRSFAQQPGEWPAWWKKHEAAIRQGTWMPAPPAEAKDTGETKSVARFFRIPIVSRRILFVIDFSGSMEAPLRVRDRGIQKRLAQYGLAPTRLGYAQAEFIRAIHAMRDGALFNVIGYSTRVKKFKGRLVELTPRTRKAAVKWVCKLETGERTNLYESLEEAFGDYLDIGGGAARFKNLPDTVLFLTDGNATIGRFQDTKDLRALVRIWNLPADVVFHTVGIGEEHDRELLSKLAADTGGFYVDVDKGLKDLKPHRRRPPEGLVTARKRIEARRERIDELLALLEDGDDDQAEAAARELAELGPAAAPAAEELADALAAIDANMRDAARAALVAIGERAVPHLIEALRGWDEDGIANAALALKEIGLPAAKKAVPVLKEIQPRLDGLTAQEAVREALKALGEG